MPSTIDYSEMLPLSIPAMASRRKFYPTNGSTFNYNGNKQIRIEVGHPSALLDATHSYLELRIRNTGAQTFGFDTGGTNCLFETIRVEQGGKLISYTQANNRLHSAILSPAMMSSEGKGTAGCTELQRSFNSNIVASIAVQPVGAAFGTYYDVGVHNSSAFFGAGRTMRMTCNITSGLFSQDKLIPLPLIDQNAPLTIVLELGDPNDVGSWNAAPGAGDLSVVECAYVAHLVEVGPDVINQFKMVRDDMGGQLALSGYEYEYFTGAVPAGTGNQIQLACPARKRSIKSLLWCAQSNDLANTVGPLANNSTLYNLSFCGNMRITSWQFAVGPILYPPGEPIRCWGNPRTAAGGGVALADAAFRRGECLNELCKALGKLGTINPGGLLSGMTYGVDEYAVADGKNGDTIGGFPQTLAARSDVRVGVSPFGVSTDGFIRDVAESGVDSQTLAQESRLMLNWATGDSGDEDFVVHMWVVSDRHYYINRDGSVTYSD